MHDALKGKIGGQYSTIAGVIKDGRTASYITGMAAMPP